MPALPAISLRLLRNICLCAVFVVLIVELMPVMRRVDMIPTGSAVREKKMALEDNKEFFPKPRLIRSSSSANKKRFNGYEVLASGSLLDRVQKFNDALSTVRRILIEENRRAKVARGKVNASEDWDDSVLSATATFIWGARDDYMEELAANHRHITTVVLPWMTTDSDQQTTSAGDSSKSGTRRWNSLEDRSNVLLQTYYQWTGDDQLCTWIVTRGAIQMKYDSVFNLSCCRDIEAAARRPHSLQPLYFYNKPINRNQYWPNDGNAYPAHYYSTPPPSVFYVHIHQDAVVTDNGDVFSGNTSLAMFVCRDSSSPPTSSLPSYSRTAPLFQEIFSLGQMWSTSVFHRAVEVIPRLAPYVDFLKANPHIRVQTGEVAGGRFGDVMGIFGLDPSRLIAGTFRAKLVYQPRETGCGMASVQEAQIAANIYRNYIVANFPSTARPRNRLILIRRTSSRGFTQHAAIEAALKSLATDYNLTFTPFYDNNMPSFNDTMALFNAAVMVVAPHGAGLSNVMFSEPGTFVIEGVCNVPHVNLCFQRLAHVLGHRYHGIASKGGCEGHVDVAADDVKQAARTFLTVYAEKLTVT